MSIKLLAHSGSSVFGELILTRHVGLYSHHGLAAGTEEFTDYVRRSLI